MTMYKGVAVNGPKDGIKLEAPITWNGRIPKHNNIAYDINYHQGYYKFDFVMRKWVWVEDLEENIVTKKTYYKEARVAFGRK